MSIILQSPLRLAFIAFYLHTQSFLLTGAARQPLFSVILSRSAYLSIYVCPQIFAAANRRATG